MANNRSSQYDWFKQGSGADGKPTKKDSLKTVFKFSKIILFLSLFIFTITGCVQSMVFKTNPEVGRSLEMYANEDEVAPHFTTFQTVETAKDVYAVQLADNNFWLNERDNKGVLDQYRKAMAQQNIAKDLKFADNYKGRVEAIRAISETTPRSDASAFVKFDNGNMAVVATKTETGFGRPTTFGTDVPVKIKINGKEVEFTNKNDWTPHLKQPSDTPINNYNQLAFFATLKAVNATAPNHNVFSGKDVDINTRNFNLVAAYFHIKPVNNKYVFSDNSLPGISGKSPWRPLSSWGRSWELGPFYGMFVYPIGYISANMIKSMPAMAGWESLFTIFIIVFIIKIFSFFVTFKSILQQTQMQELSSKKAVIEAKYAAYKDNKQMQSRKNQEIQAMYKKHGVSPFGTIAPMVLVMPFFFAILRVTYGLPHLKSTEWLGIKFGATSWRELFAGGWQYLPLMLFAMGFAAMQQILPRLLTKRRDKDRINVHQKEALKKSNKTQNVMIIVSIVISVIFSAGMQVYYIASGSWMIIQSFITHHILLNQSKKRKLKKIKV